MSFHKTKKLLEKLGFSLSQSQEKEYLVYWRGILAGLLTLDHISIYQNYVIGEANNVSGKKLEDVRFVGADVQDKVKNLLRNILEFDETRAIREKRIDLVKKYFAERCAEGVV